MTEPVAAAPSGNSCGITLLVRRQHPPCRYPRPVLIKARLKGHELDLLTLAELFRAGDPAVATDDEVTT